MSTAYVTVRGWDHEPAKGKHYHAEPGDPVPATLPKPVRDHLLERGAIVKAGT